MRRRLQESAGWRYDLLWHLVDLRYQQPKLLLGIVAALVSLAALISIAALGVGGGTPQISQSPWPERSTTATVETDPHGRPVRYVPYNGLARSEEAGVLEESSADQNGSGVVLQRLSDVLRDRYDESDLIFGSDGAEGAILPLDNGVVPSSGPRFSTHWELILPSAGIRAAVVQVGLTHDGAMGSPDNPFVVGWFNRSAVPGKPGNALLGGHRDYQDLNGNIDVGVCWELDETRVGDQLIMFEHSSNRYYVYDIVDTVTIRPDSQEAIKYLSQTRESVVTLITCAGDFDEDTHSYSERIVVVALLNAVATPDT